MSCKKLQSSDCTDVSPVCGYHSDENLSFPWDPEVTVEPTRALEHCEDAGLHTSLLHCLTFLRVLGGESCRQKFSLEVKEIVTGKLFSGVEWICLSGKLEVLEEFLAALIALN